MDTGRHRSAAPCRWPMLLFGQRRYIQTLHPSFCMGQRSSGGGWGARVAAPGGAAPPRGAPSPRGIDTSFELVAMETANGAGRRRGFDGGCTGLRETREPAE
ncbi:unnamed protein product [Parnassius apollo]|uniref:(apollo) hypothetical protein n=1 Tax=Parnassius apollo TaxID=110799 RepID=A0A8S3WV55_PARAO|nr:unnamed protein product [Parnassius apollo]